MTTVARCNAAFAALGAGLVHLSIGAGRDDPGTAALVSLGVAELIWAVLVLARGTIVAPRTALAVTATTMAGLVLAIGAGLLRDPLPALAAGVLQIFAAAVVAAALRRPPGEERPVAAVRAVVGLLAGALTVSALATPALSATAEAPGGGGGAMSTSVIQGGHGH